MLSLPQPYPILLSFDLEEFDIPNEYGGFVSESLQMDITREGMGRLLPLLQTLDASCTFFTTANYALQNQHQVKQLATEHEIASHAFYHSQFTQGDILHSKQVLESIAQSSVTGFRMPRLAEVPRDLLTNAGYAYDASLNPTLLPGRYNKLHSPRTIFREGNLSVVPASVTPNLRIPLFWLAFKNCPLSLFKRWSGQVLNRDGYISLYFHPWEYASLERFTNLPGYVRRPSGERLLEKLANYLHWLSSLGEFTTMHDFVQKRNQMASPGLGSGETGTRLLLQNKV